MTKIKGRNASCGVYPEFHEGLQHDKKKGNHGGCPYETGRHQTNPYNQMYLVGYASLHPPYLTGTPMNTVNLGKESQGGEE